MYDFWTTHNCPRENILFILCSLENFSDKIRWSLDLRWQSPDKDNGFHGIKDCMLMRTAKDPNYVPDWSEMVGIDRTTEQMSAIVS